VRRERPDEVRHPRWQQDQRQKKTDIGHSPLTRFRSKRKKRHAKLFYRGLGKPLWVPKDARGPRRARKGPAGLG